MKIDTTKNKILKFYKIYFEKISSNTIFKILKEVIKITIILFIIFYILFFNSIVRPNFIKSLKQFQTEKREVEKSGVETKENYYILKRERSLVLGFTGHTFLEMRDENGNTISQLHGLATDKSGHHKEVGADNKDYTLKVWEFKEDFYKQDLGKSIGNTGIILAQGNSDYIKSLWSKAEICGSDINSKNIQYPKFGFRFIGKTYNSNSVADTLIDCMNLQDKNIGLFTPGRNNNILNDFK